MHEVRLDTALSMPAGFRFSEVPSHTVASPLALAPSLGPLAAFTGTFRGHGFNTIFRPQNAKTPTTLPELVPASDNILELNLTEETLSFPPVWAQCRIGGRSRDYPGAADRPCQPAAHPHRRAEHHHHHGDHHLHRPGSTAFRRGHQQYRLSTWQPSDQRA